MSTVIEPKAKVKTGRLTKKEKNAITIIVKEARSKNKNITYKEMLPSLILAVPALKEKGRALGAYVTHLTKTLDQEEKESIEKSTKAKHMVKQAQEAQNMDKASVDTLHENGSESTLESTDGSSNTDHDRSEGTIDPSSLPQTFVAEVFSPQPLQTGSIQAKTLEKKLTVVSDQLKAFQLFEQGLNSLEIMGKLNAAFPEVYRWIQEYRALRAMEQKNNKFVSDDYMGAFLQNAKVLGETYRDGCKHFTDETGICEFWQFKEPDEEFRKTYAGLFQTSEGGRVKLKVRNHSYICALCLRASAFTE